MKKTAFKRPEHEKIAKGILRDRFDAGLFLQVHDYIDLREMGRNHRRKHGHNRAAEEEIGRLWQTEGVDHFAIHILADWVYDHLAEVVGEYYDKHKAGDTKVTRSHIVKSRSYEKVWSLVMRPPQLLL